MAITARAAGTWAEFTADGTVAIPAGSTTGDRMFLLAAWKAFDTTAQVTDWTEITEFADGSTAAGSNVGSVKVGVWYKDHDGSETDPTLDWSTGPVPGCAVIVTFQKASGDVWDTPAFATAAISAATNWTATASSNPGITAGDLMIGLCGFRDDSATMTRNGTTGLAATGITWSSNLVEYPTTHFSTTTSNDISADGCYRIASSGTASAAPTMTGTLSASETGAALWIRQRLAPTQTSVARISLASGSIPTSQTSHSIKVRARTTAGAGTIRAALYESTNNRSGDLESAALTTSLADYTLAIADGNAANITDYSDLEIRLWGYAGQSGAIVFEVDQLWLEIPAAGVAAYSLDCQPGSFTVTGTAATLAAARLFQADPGSFTVTGIAATVVVGYAISSDPGSYTVTGADATLLADRAGLEDPGSFTVSGVAATLSAGLVFSADPGSHAVTGTDASPVAGFAVLADGGSFAVTGPNADLVYTPVGAFTLDAQPGAFAVTGSDAGLAYAALISIDAQPGVVAVTGTDATLAAGRVFAADPASYAVTGANVAVVPDRALSADPGSYAVSGLDAATLVGRALMADQGTCTVTGFDASLVLAVPGVFVLDAQPGGYTVSGINATAIATRELAASPATYAVTGTAAALSGEHSIAATSSTFAITGSDASILAERMLDASPGTIIFTGFAASVGTLFDMEIDAEAGNIAVTGATANLVFQPGLARLTTRGGRIRWNTTGQFHGENRPGRITQTREGAVA